MIKKGNDKFYKVSQVLRLEYNTRQMMKHYRKYNKRSYLCQCGRRFIVRGNQATWHRRKTGHKMILIDTNGRK